MGANANCYLGSDVTVGQYGAGLLSIDEGGQLASMDGYIAANPGSTGSATVNGTWDILGTQLVVGGQGNSGEGSTTPGGIGQLNIGPTGLVGNYPATYNVGPVATVYGNLIDDGILGSPTVNVQPGGNLGGNGNVLAQPYPEGDGIPPAIVTNDGTVTPGDPVGTLSIAGNFAQNADGTLAIPIGAAGSGELSVLGTATIDGTLGVNLINNYVPRLGTTYYALDADTIVGQFANAGQSQQIYIGETGFNVNYGVDPSTGMADVELNVISVPTLTWDGGGGSAWDENQTGSWQDDFGDNGLTFSDNYATQFDDSNTSGNTINVTQTVSPSYVVVDSDTNNYTFSGAGSISALQLLKYGASTLTVTNSNSIGYTVIAQGTLQLGNGGSTGDVGSLFVDDEGTLVIDRSDSFEFSASIFYGSGSVTQAGPGTTTLIGSNAYTGNTTVSNGTLVIGAAGALPAGGRVINNAALDIYADSTSGLITGTGALTIGRPHLILADSGGMATVSGEAGPPPVTLTIAPNSGANTEGSLTINGASSLDLTNNRLFIDYGTNPDPVGTIRQYLASGYNGGGWNGNGLISSAANATQSTSSKYALGYADSADPGNPAGLAAGTIEVMYTLVGDLTLQGAVSGQDFAILAGNFNSLSKPRWDAGDVTYDGAISGADFAALAGNFGKLDSGASLALSAADWAAFDAFAAEEGGFGTSVPEPASGGMLLIGGAVLAARRRRAAGR